MKALIRRSSWQIKAALEGDRARADASSDRAHETQIGAMHASFVVGRRPVCSMDMTPKPPAHSADTPKFELFAGAAWRALLTWLGSSRADAVPVFARKTASMTEFLRTHADTARNSTLNDKLLQGMAILAASLTAVALAACGAAPSRTETTTSDTVERAEGGGEVRRSTTQTSETSADGVQTVDRTETTETSPAPQ